MMKLAVMGCAAMAAICCAGCIDVRSFEGAWIGTISAEPAVRQGFVEGVQVNPLLLDQIDLEGLNATLTTSDGRFDRSPLSRVVKANNDTLASLSFDGSPLRSYLLYAPLASDPDGCPANILISLFTDSRVQLRIWRGNDLYALFPLVERKDE